MLSELWSDLRYRLRALVRRADLEAELDAELRFHLERETEKYERLGLPPADAVRRARLAFGGLDRMKEESRDARGTALAETLLRDLRYALRSLRSQPTFTLAVVLILGIGIGANTAIFTLIDALLLRTLPVSHPEQLVTIGDPAAVGSGWMGSPMTDYASYPLYVDLRDRNSVLSGLYASGSPGDLDVAVRGGATDPGADIEHPRGRLVSGNYFSVLGIPAYIGRTFTATEDRAPLADPVAVLSYGFWQRRFGGNRSTVGSTIAVNGVPLTIIGVTPPTFAGDIVGETTDLWMPMMMQPALMTRGSLLGDRSASWLQMMGRLAPGVTLEQARAVLSTIELQSIRAHLTGIQLSRFEEDLKAAPIRVEAGARGFSRQRKMYGEALVVLMAAVGLVVLVVCANVANLMLARAAARGREMTVRMALGAGRLRLTQQLLTESTLLATIAGALGLIAARWGSRILLVIASAGQAPMPLDVAPDARALAFTAGVTLLSVMLFGLVPALRATRVDVATALRAHGRSLSGARMRLGRFAVGKALVICQVGLSTLLLIGTGLLVRSMQRIVTADLGLDRDRVVVVQVEAARRGYAGPRLVALMRDLADRAQHVPGVLAVSYSQQGVFTGVESTGHVTVPGFVAQADSQRAVRYDDVGPSYFHAIGANVLRGRDFDARDSETGAKVAVINETMARYYFRGSDPIGRTVTHDSSTFTIVGVVRDVEEEDVRARPVRRLYLSIFQSSQPPRSFNLEVRFAGEPSRFVAPLRAALVAADHTLPTDIEPLDELIRESVAQDVLLTQVTAFFGIVALVLAALGLYGVTAYATTQRTGEFGLRVALGAEPKSIARMILQEAVGLALLGVALGLPIGLAATRLIRARIFGVAPLDPPSLGVAVTVLVATALVASYLPARRAARVPPLEALRTE